MSEIEKLYENVGLLYCSKCRHDSELDCIYMCESKYPPFTAEKQIGLIKWLVCTPEEAITFEETLSKQVNDLWQSLTEEEKQQVKGILE